MKEFSIGSRFVGGNNLPLVIAEIGINHEGSLETAIAMADSAINTGAEVIKHQTHIVNDEMSIEAKSIKPSHVDTPIFEIIERCALNEDEEYKLMQHVKQRGAIFISTPFSRAAANRLREFEIPAYKIGSGECNNYPLVKHIAAFGKPVILSTGMNSVETIKPAVEILRNAKVPYALLHCTNIYPTPPRLVRLGALQILENYFSDAVVGLSDHTTTNHTAFGAVALGAKIIEKHFTDKSSRPGPDISSSMDPDSLRELLQGITTIHDASGGEKGPLPEESGTMAFAFASVVAIKDINPGDLFTTENIWVMRPGSGDYPASEFQDLLGKKAATQIKDHHQIKRSDVEYE